mgnify:CR=1 FL=1
MKMAAIAAAVLIVLYVLYRKYKTEIKDFYGKGAAASLDKTLLLEEGVKGQEVEQLQKYLKRDGGAGFLGTSGEYEDGVDGDFGTLTKAALQEVKGVEKTTLNQYNANSSIATSTQEKTYTSSDIKTTW